MRLKHLLIPLAASVALLAGCTPGNPLSTSSTEPVSNGVENLEPEEILGKAVEALAGAESFRMAGMVGDGTFAAMIDVVYAGDDVQGTGTILGLAIEIIKIGPDIYLSADPSLFAAYVPADQQDTLETIANSWVKVPAEWVAFLMPVPLSAEEVVADVDFPAPLTKGEPATVGSTPAITVTDGDGAVYSVATVGEPYLLKAEYEGSSITYSRFNETATIEAPEDAIDILELIGLDGIGLN